MLPSRLPQRELLCQEKPRFVNHNRSRYVIYKARLLILLYNLKLYSDNMEHFVRDTRDQTKILDQTLPPQRSFLHSPTVDPEMEAGGWGGEVGKVPQAEYNQKPPQNYQYLQTRDSVLNNVF